MHNICANINALTLLPSSESLCCSRKYQCFVDFRKAFDRPYPGKNYSKNSEKKELKGVF